MPRSDRERTEGFRALMSLYTDTPSERTEGFLAFLVAEYTQRLGKEVRLRVRAAK